MDDTKTLNSVRCDVSSCVHNVDGCACSADSIKVCCTCTSPDCADETLCRTFRARQQ
ncbi:MAG: DUF1540 domain-containing protein [Ruminococcus sp.]|nr:DUF1540 domain-containing protein [Ruminococcus sp.]